MKTFFKSIAASLMAVALLVAITLALLAPPTAQAQVVPGNIVTLTNFPPILAGTASSNVNSTIPIFKDRGVALQAKFNAASGTADTYLWIRPSADGTNTATAPEWLWTLPANGTTDVVATTNWSAAQLAGWQSLTITTWSNKATAAAILTNKGFIYSSR